MCFNICNTLTNNCIACFTAKLTDTKRGQSDQESSVICIEYSFEWTLEFVVYLNSFVRLM